MYLLLFIYIGAEDTITKDFRCVGIAFGLIGQFDGDKLLLIRQKHCVGRIPGYLGREEDVFRIKKIAIIHLNGSDIDQHDLALEPCPFHSEHSTLERTATDQANSTSNGTPVAANQSKVSSATTGAVQKTWSSIKSATSHVKPSRVMGRSNATNNPVDPKERYEWRLIDEMVKMFNDSDSFYYSPNGDLTNTMQRKYKKIVEVEGVGSDAQSAWARLDDRFFWNRFMISSLIALSDSGANKWAGHWVLPIIQGFVQCEHCLIDVDAGVPGDMGSGPRLTPNTSQEFVMIIISRRSRFRAGTRYKKRGADEFGKCANYVETEQIFKYNEHVVSFYQVRGSVPIFWSQPGYAYRPPPKLDRTEDDSKLAFKVHFDEEFDIYGKVAAVNLVEHSGREGVIFDAYLNQVINLDSDKLTYVSFDFHEYW